SLISLRTDVPIPFETVLQERVPRDVPMLGFAVEGDDMEDLTTTDEQSIEAEAAEAADTSAPAPVTALATREAEILPASSEWERQLDPRSMREARLVAADMFNSRMFSAYGNPQGVLSTVMVGRELGLP